MGSEGVARGGCRRDWLVIRGGWDVHWVAGACSVAYVLDVEVSLHNRSMSMALSDL